MASEDQEIKVADPSDFGVLEMGHVEEIVSDYYAHDALRYPDEPPPDYAGATIMGGLQMPCWWRNEDHFRLHPINVGFRCCMDDE